MTTFGRTPAGFVPKSADDALQGVRDSLLAQFGENIDLSPGSVFGSLAEIFSAPIAEAWQLLADVYASDYRATATGASLDGVGELINAFRLPGLPTKVAALISGDEGTLVPAGSLASTASGKNLFEAAQDAVITAASAVSATVQVAKALDQDYTVTINKVDYTVAQADVESLAEEFFVDGDDNGFLQGLTLVKESGTIPLGAVFYWSLFLETDAYDEITTLCLNLYSDPGKQLPPVALGSVEVVEHLDFPISVPLGAANGSGISGSVTLTGYAEDTDSGNKITKAISAAKIAESLVDAINASIEPLPFLRQDNQDGTFTIMPTEGSPPFSISTLKTENSALIVSAFQCLQEYASVEHGPVPCIGSDLSVIVSPISGWNGITNPISAEPLGQQAETDTAFRLRIAASPRMNSSATSESIRERLVQEVPGVQHAFVFENLTDEMDDGRPPHSIEVLVDAPTDDATQQAVAQEILKLKPVGITTCSTATTQLSVPIIDSQGDPHTIIYSAPDSINIWIDIEAETVDADLLPDNWKDLVQENVLALAATYGIGQNVPMQAFYPIILSVPGIESVLLDYAFRNPADDDPDPELGTLDYTPASDGGLVPITGTQIASFSAEERLFIRMAPPPGS